MAFSKVKKELEALSKAQIITLVGELYKKNKSTKEYLDHFANPDESALFEKYAKQLRDVFFPSRGKIDLRKGRKALAEFKKLGTSAEKNVELMLVYVQTGIEASHNYWQLDDSYYNSLLSVFEEALKRLQKEEMLTEFQIRIQNLIAKVKSWSFEYNLTYYYEKYYPAGQQPS